jgi:protease-4
MEYEEYRGPEPTPEAMPPIEPAPPVEVSAQAPPPPAPPPPPRKVSGWRIFWGVVVALSVLANVVLFFMIVMMVSFFMSGPAELFDSRDGFGEDTLVKGPASRKIAVIRVEGIIDGAQSEKFKKHLKAAGDDANVKAVIVRTITPGGTVSASDQMHNAIIRFRRESGKPVVAFMQTVAASGGYYTSVACDKIIAEPTVITGSIGVILNNIVIKELLEEKLGVQPVVIKSGLKKDWPSMFSETTEEQKQYLFDKLIDPAYERFVNLVDQGREGLSEADVRRLADGSIYGAEEAKDNKLIDQVGYFEDAVELTENLAGIRGARVVEYTRLFTISSLLGAEAKTRPWEIDRNTLYELTAPQLMYLWDGCW